MLEADKNWIEAATYEQLLRRWRHASVGDQMFQGGTGDYYAKVMEEKKQRLPHNEQVNVSKNVG